MVYFTLVFGCIYYYVFPNFPQFDCVVLIATVIMKALP